MNESAWKTPLFAIVCVAVGAVAGWLYRDREASSQATNQAITANGSLVEELAAVKDAAPAIALQIAALQQTAATARRLNGEFANNRELLVAMSDCPIPDRLHSLAIQRTEAINASASGEK